MQLHEFAPEILIEALLGRVGIGRLAGLESCGLRIGSNAQPVVQVKEHGWALGHRSQKIAEFAKGIGADGVAFITGDQVWVLVLEDKDVEVVKPEVGHHFFELALAVNGS